MAVNGFLLMTVMITQDSIIYLKHFESIGFIEHQKANAIVFDLKVSPMGTTPLPPISA